MQASAPIDNRASKRRQQPTSGSNGSRHASQRGEDGVVSSDQVPRRPKPEFYIVEFSIRCVNLPQKDHLPPDPVVGLYQIDFAKSVAQFLSNTEPIISSCNPQFGTVLSLQRYQLGSSLVVAFYVYNTHAAHSFGAGGMLEAKPEDCAGYCVLNLHDVSKQAAGESMEIGYPLRHPEGEADSYLATIQAKLCVRMRFRKIEDTKDESGTHLQEGSLTEGSRNSRSSKNEDKNNSSVDSLKAPALPRSSKYPMKPTASLALGEPLGAEVWSRPSRLSFR